MRIIRNKSIAAAGFALLTSLPGVWAENVLNVYSHRHYGVDEEVHKLFKERTGIEVRVVNADADQLIERLRSEGANSPADVFITVDVARMERADALGLLGKFDASRVQLPEIPAAMLDPEAAWYPFTIRTRAIMTAKGRVKPGEIKRYEDLADAKWRGRLLIRSASNSYNQALMASMVAAHGEREATTWARNVANNLARPPQGGDRDQIKAVAAGLADVCVANTYYLGMMLESSDPAERAAARKIDVVFPNQADRGAHANVSAIALLEHADNVDAAHRYLAFLLTPEIQQMLAAGTYEHPVAFSSDATPVHRAWGDFKIDTTTFGDLAKHHDAAVKAFDTAKWR